MKILQIIKIMERFLLLSFLILVLGFNSGCGSDGTGTGAGGTGGASGAAGPPEGATAANPSEGFYVKEGGSGKKDGSSWENAFGDLQAAIEAAGAKDSTKKKVYIAQGTYKPQGHPNGRTGDRAKHFALKNGVTVIGGYPGLKDNEPNIIEPSKTFLSGDLGDNDTADETTKTDNAYHVFYHLSGLTSSAKLSNVTITKGNTSSSNGGGMSNSGSSPSLTNVTFSNNNAYRGGGMSNSDSSPKLINVTFESNIAAYGGGMRNYNSSPILDNVKFERNKATISGGGMYNSGSSRPTFSNVCRFTGNMATGDDGKGGAIYDDRSSTPVNPENAKDGDGNTITSITADNGKDNGYYKKSRSR